MTTATLDKPIQLASVPKSSEPLWKQSGNVDSKGAQQEAKKRIRSGDLREVVGLVSTSPEDYRWDDLGALLVWIHDWSCHWLWMHHLLGRTIAAGFKSPREFTHPNPESPHGKARFQEYLKLQAEREKQILAPKRWRADYDAAIAAKELREIAPEVDQLYTSRAVLSGLLRYFAPSVVTANKQLVPALLKDRDYQTERVPFSLPKREEVLLRDLAEGLAEVETRLLHQLAREDFAKRFIPTLHARMAATKPSDLVPICALEGAKG